MDGTESVDKWHQIHIIEPIRYSVDPPKEELAE